MTDKVQKIRAEIERQIAELTPTKEKIGIVGGAAVKRHLDSLLSFIDSLQEKPVSTKDKLLALSDGRLHLGWIDDAKVVEFEECLMQFHKDMSNIPQDTDSLIRLKDTDGVLHGYSKKLMSMAKEEPVSEELEEAADFYVNTHTEWFDADNNPHVSPAFKAGAKWQKENLWKPADGDDLPEIDREVIAILDYDFGHYKVVYAHRPNPNGWNGTNIDTGEKSHFEPAIYDKGGWNIPNVKWWLDYDINELLCREK